MTLTFHHVGIGTKSFEKAIDVYERLDHRLLVSVDDPIIDARIALLACPRGGPMVEIVAPLGPEGPLKSLLERRMLPTPYHTCYAVKSIQEGTETLRGAGFMPIGEPRPAKAFDGALVCFYYNRFTGLVELVEGNPLT